MFAEFLTQNEFFDEYIKLFSTRFTMGSLRVEDSKTDLTSTKRAIELYNNMKAFMELIKKNPEKLSPYDIVDVADIVNKNLNYFSKGFRKVGVEVRGATFFPTEAKDVIPEMYNLFDCYHNIWNILPVYEREARFHIKFLRIHPFEDGNGRTSRIITSFNLCKENKAPIVISSRERKKYFSYINNNDVDSLALFFEKKSKEELEVMIELYKAICGDTIVSKECSDEKSNVRISSLLEEVKKENELSMNTSNSYVNQLKYLNTETKK